MGPFPPSKKCEFILVAVDYVSKWVEALPCKHVLIFGNAIRNESASALISVSTSPGMFSRVSYLYFYQ